MTYGMSSSTRPLKRLKEEIKEEHILDHLQYRIYYANPIGNHVILRGYRFIKEKMWPPLKIIRVDNEKGMTKPQHFNPPLKINVFLTNTENDWFSVDT